MLCYTDTPRWCRLYSGAVQHNTNLESSMGFIAGLPNQGPSSIEDVATLGARCKNAHPVGQEGVDVPGEGVARETPRGHPAKRDMEKEA